MTKRTISSQVTAFSESLKNFVNAIASFHGDDSTMDTYATLIEGEFSHDIEVMGKDPKNADYLNKLIGFRDSLMEVLRDLSPDAATVIAAHLKWLYPQVNPHVNTTESETTESYFVLDFNSPEGCRAWREYKQIDLEAVSEVTGYSIDVLTLFEAGQIKEETARLIRMAYRLFHFWNHDSHVATELIKEYGTLIAIRDPEWYENLVEHYDLHEDEESE